MLIGVTDGGGAAADDGDVDGAAADGGDAGGGDLGGDGGPGGGEDGAGGNGGAGSVGVAHKNLGDTTVERDAGNFLFGVNAGGGFGQSMSVGKAFQFNLLSMCREAAHEKALSSKCFPQTLRVAHNWLSGIPSKAALRKLITHFLHLST